MLLEELHLLNGTVILNWQRRRGHPRER